MPRHSEEMQAHRDQTLREAGGDPDDLKCAQCGKRLSHDEAQIMIGLPSDPSNSFGPVLPPQAFCDDHPYDGWKTTMEKEWNKLWRNTK